MSDYRRFFVDKITETILIDGEEFRHAVNVLRIKESDRLKETVTRLNAFGIKATETADGMEIIGSTSKGADITSAGDHRIVMCFSVLAAISNSQTTIDDALAINKSYPTFFDDYKSIGGACYVI